MIRTQAILPLQVDFSRQSRANRCFHVIRTDGTQEDFSYHKCLRVRRGILEQAPEAAPAPSLLQVGIGTHAELGSSC